MCRCWCVYLHMHTHPLVLIGGSASKEVLGLLCPLLFSHVLECLVSASLTRTESQWLGLQLAVRRAPWS